MAVTRSPSWGRVGRRLAALVVLLLVLVLPVPPAQAHTSLLSTDPVADSVHAVPPEAVTLRFSAPVDVELGGLRVVGPDGDRVDDDTTTRDGGATVTAEVDADDPGTYAVSWSVVSADSHVISGSFVFHVQEGSRDRGRDGEGEDGSGAEGRVVDDAETDTGDDPGDARDGGAPSTPTAPALPEDPTSPALPTTPVDPGTTDASSATTAAFSTSTAVAAVRWVSRWVLLSGTTVLGGLLLFRLVVSPTPTLRSTRAAHVATGAAAAILLGSFARLVAHVAEASGRTLLEALSLLDDAVLGTAAGMQDALRVLAGATALGTALLWRRRGPLGGAVATLAVLAVLVVMVSLALSGHPSTAAAPSLAVASDVVHHAAASVWIGGLAVLGLVLGPSLGRGGRADDATALAVRRFSAVALGAVVVVAVTGVASAAQQSGMDPATLLSTRYGATLMVKLVLVAALLGLGLWQRTRLVRVVTTSVSVFRTARLELVVVALLLGTTAMLVNTPPAREALEPQSFTSTVDDRAGAVDVILTPARAGANALHLSFYDQVGSPRTVDVATATVAREGLPPRQVELLPVSSSYWVAADVHLPARGTWTITVTTLGRSVEGGFTVDVEVAEAAGEG